MRTKDSSSKGSMSKWTSKATLGSWWLGCRSPSRSPSARVNVCFRFLVLKKYLTYLSKRVYQSWKDCSNLRVWTNWFEALNPRPCPRGQCSFVVVRRAKFLSLAWRGKITDAFLWKLNQQKCVLGKKKFVWNFTVFSYYELK